MTSRNVNIGRRKPSSEQIGRFKDFGSVKARVDEFNGIGRAAEGIGTMAKALVVTALLVTVAGGTWITSDLLESNVILQKYTEDAGSVPAAAAEAIDHSFQPPFRPVDLEFTEYIVDASKGAELTYSTGTKISIPAHAFLNRIGRPLKGRVKVKYREMHNSIDLLLSGIPMKYQDADYMETAGMMELKAFKTNGEEVFSNPDRKITIHLASSEPSQAYNLYHFDEDKSRWVYKGEDEVTVFESGERGARNKSAFRENKPKSAGSFRLDEHNQAGRMIGIRNMVDYAPVLKLSDHEKSKGRHVYHFMFTDAEETQPEMAAFRDMVWHYNRSIQAEDTRFFEDLLSNNYKGGNYIYRYWDYVQVSYDPPADYMTMVFVRTDKDKILKVNLIPSFGGDYREKTPSDVYRRYKVIQDSIAAADMGKLNAPNKLNASSTFIQRSFSIDGFGLWSCDKFFRHKTPQVITVNFTDVNGETVNYQRLFCVYKEPKSVIRFGSSKRISIDRAGEFVIVAIMDDHRIGYITPDQVKSIPPNAQHCDLAFTISTDIRGTLVRLKHYFSGETAEPAGP